jgi:hypothetical protein
MLHHLYRAISSIHRNVTYLITLLTHSLFSARLRTQHENMKTTISVILLGLAAVTPSSVAMDKLVLPASANGAEGNCNTAFPFWFPCRFQQVYSSTAFTTGAVTITQIAFRAPGNLDFFGFTTDKIIFSLSTTSKLVDGLSTTLLRTLMRIKFKRCSMGSRLLSLYPARICRMSLNPSFNRFPSSLC